MTDDTTPDVEPQHSMYRRRFLQAASAAALTVSGIGTAQASESTTNGHTHLAAGSPWGLGWKPPKDVEVVRHHEEPTWLVRYHEGETSTLRDWIGKSDDRHEINQFDASTDLEDDSPLMVLAAPAKHIGFGLITVSGDLLSRSYVESVDLDHRVSYTEPVDPVSAGDASPMDGVSWLTAKTRGVDNLGRGLAYDEDMETATMQDVRDVTNATSSDITLPDTSAVTIAVIDSGINTADDDSIFGGRVLASSKNTITGETGVDAIEDGNGHGTFVAAQIASGAAEPYKGYADSADVLGIKALDDDGSGRTSDILEGIRFAADQGADVACLSLGSPVYSYELDQALSYAAGAGMVCILAAGNDRFASRWVASPASGTDGIAISASTGDPSDEAQIGYFSNHGPHSGSTDFSGGHTAGSTPELAAPGCKVETKVPRADGVVEVQEKTGTSMAAPDVVGAVGILYADSDGPRGDFEKTLGRVRNGQVMAAAGETEDGGHGMLDVKAMLDNTERDNLDETDDEAAARDQSHRGLSRAQGGWIKVI